MRSLNDTRVQHQTHGQIRKMCKLKCPELCQNTNTSTMAKMRFSTKWEYYNGNDEDNEGHQDDTMSLHCPGKIRYFLLPL